MGSNNDQDTKENIFSVNRKDRGKGEVNNTTIDGVSYSGEEQEALRKDPLILSYYKFSFLI